MKYLVKSGQLDEQTMKNCLDDFPLPSTKNSIQNLRKYWVAMAKEMKIDVETTEELKQATMLDFGVEVEQVESTGTVWYSNG